MGWTDTSDLCLYLYKLLNEAYVNFTTEENEGSLFKEKWAKKREAKNPQCQFQNLIFPLVSAVFSLIRPFREAEFLLYRKSLQDLMLYFLIYYVRWLPFS